MKNNKILFAIFIFALPLVSCALQNNTSNDITNDTTNSSEIVYDETQSLHNLSFEVISEAEKTCGVKGCKEFYSDMRDSQIIIPREINGYKVTEVLDSAFEYCDFVKEVIMFERMKIIGDNAFNCCTSLTSITIPNSVTSIGEFAFIDCFNLDKAFYAGSEAEWSSISVGYGNDRLYNRYYYSEEEPTGSGNYWHYVDGVPTIWHN